MSGDETRKPQDWAASDGRYILDPDGWRTADAPPFDQPITRAEYDRRVIDCTIGPLSVVAASVLGSGETEGTASE